MVSHIGLTINEKEDIAAFYKDILGLEIIEEFGIGEDYSQKIFGLDKQAPIKLLQKDELTIELFITDKSAKPVYNHIELYVQNISQILDKVRQKNYPFTIIERSDEQDLIFIQDGSGNKFELKQSTRS